VRFEKRNDFKTGGCVRGLEPRETGWQLEQQRQELSFGELQQEQSVEHEQQHRLPRRSARNAPNIF